MIQVLDVLILVVRDLSYLIDYVEDVRRAVAVQMLAVAIVSGLVVTIVRRVVIDPISRRWSFTIIRHGKNTR